MHYLFIFLVFPLGLWAASQQEVKEAHASIKALIAPLVPGADGHRPKELEKFRVDGCEKQKINWSDVIFMRNPVTLKYTFKEGCDIQGTISPKILRPFPVELDLQNLENFNKIACQNTVTAGLEARPLLFLEIRNGVLTGKKGQVKFEADYQVRLNPLNPKAFDRNDGGEIRITEIYGKKSNIKEKIIIR